jgi:hypothetical protein
MRKREEREMDFTGGAEKERNTRSVLIRNSFLLNNN